MIKHRNIETNSYQYSKLHTSCLGYWNENRNSKWSSVSTLELFFLQLTLLV